jgi:hypothetical protein
MIKQKQVGVFSVTKESHLHGIVAWLRTGKFMGAICNNIYGESLWWSKEHKTFTSYEKRGKEGASTHSPHKSHRAFYRFLRKHPELKGCKIRLCSRYVDNDLIAE